MVDFLGADAPLPDKREGVKLGESTLNRFLLLARRTNPSACCLNLGIWLIYLSDWCAALTFWGS
jgi:hypothetical protein